MNKIYVVTSGCYSDFSIEGIFSTELKAEKLRKDFEWANSDASIETWGLNRTKKRRFIMVSMKKDGEVVDIDHRLNGTAGLCCFFNNADLTSNDYDTFDWVVATGDEKRAIKVVNEKRSQILALGIWADTKKVLEMVK